MSPPIRDGSGSSIGSIRLGDGTDISEVRTGAGDVLFSGNAIPDSVVDNFEAATANPAGPYDSGETIANYYSGDTGSYQRTTTGGTEGSHALQLTSAPDAIWSHPGDGLPEYPKEGDTISFLVRDSASGDFPVALSNVEDSASPNCYGFELDQDSIGIYRYDSGNFDDFGTQLTKSSVGASDDTWYFGEVSLPAAGSNSITYSLYNLDNNNEKGSQVGSISTTDSNVSTTNRGIGWATRTASIQGNGVMYDRMRIES